MKKLVGLLVFVFFLGTYAQAQVLDPVLGPRSWKKENVGQRQAVTLTHIREADVMFSTRIWRELDLRQKINLPLYFPLDSAVHGKRSFIQILFDNYLINPNNFGPNGIKLYKTSEYEEVYTYEEILSIVSRRDSVQIVDEYGDIIDTLAQHDWTSTKPEIVKVRLMEDWFFDKQRSVQDVRILGLALMIPDYTTKTSVDPNSGQAVFDGYERLNTYSEIWFFFPQILQTLAVLECYKRQNDAARLSYDDIFLQRIFSSYIYKQENVYDRKIADYTAGLDALLEADRIKNNIFEEEQDLWQY